MQNTGGMLPAKRFQTFYRKRQSIYAIVIDAFSNLGVEVRARPIRPQRIFSNFEDVGRPTAINSTPHSYCLYNEERVLKGRVDVLY